MSHATRRRHDLLQDARVVAVGGETLDLPAVCARANAELGKTQRISALKQLVELPRSHIGKILKTALRDMVS